MKRSHLKLKFLNTRCDHERKAYNCQRNFFVSLLRKEKNEFNGNPNTNILTKNRTFWKTAKLFLAGKTKKFSRKTLIEKENII